MYFKITIICLKIKKQKKESRKERKDKKIQIAAAIGIVALLIISFVVSQNSKKIDPAIIDAVAVTEPAAHLYGNADAPLTLVEYSDFQCPACKNAAPQIKQLLAEYPDKFQLEYRHFPLRSIHPNAQIAAQAAEAAGMQGKFWEMHDMLFDRQSEWSESFNPKRFFGDYAVELGMSPERLIYDLESDKVKEIVNAQFDQASEMGLPGTPAFVLDGEQIDMGTFVNTHLVEETSTEEGETEVVENEITE
ncbi:MAG: DsbA family protein [Minisyncoccia bacterium]